MNRSRLAILIVVFLLTLGSQTTVLASAPAGSSTHLSNEGGADFDDSSLDLWSIHRGEGHEVESEPATGAVSLWDPSLRTPPPTGVRCRLATPDGCASEPPASVAPLTITDLASFTPAVGQLIVQPDNWGVLGIPTNFVATATDHVQHGTLLGQPIEVRWRPTAFTFDYGDGTTTTTTEPDPLSRTPDVRR